MARGTAVFGLVAAACNCAALVLLCALPCCCAVCYLALARRVVRGTAVFGLVAAACNCAVLLCALPAAVLRAIWP